MEEELRRGQGDGDDAGGRGEEVQAGAEVGAECVGGVGGEGGEEDGAFARKEAGELRAREGEC